MNSGRQHSETRRTGEFTGDDPMNGDVTYNTTTLNYNQNYSNSDVSRMKPGKEPPSVKEQHSDAKRSSSRAQLGGAQPECLKRLSFS